MAIWLGGVVLLTRVVLAGPGEDDLVHAVRGFSRISTPALLVTIVTGAILTYRLDRGGLFDTAHGRVLLLKAVVVCAMVFVGLATRQFVRTRLRKVDAMTVPLASRLRRATGHRGRRRRRRRWLLSVVAAVAVTRRSGRRRRRLDYGTRDAGSSPTTST